MATRIVTLINKTKSTTVCSGSIFYSNMSVVTNHNKQFCLELVRTWQRLQWKEWARTFSVRYNCANLVEPAFEYWSIVARVNPPPLVDSSTDEEPDEEPSEESDEESDEVFNEPHMPRITRSWLRNWRRHYGIYYYDHYVRLEHR